MLFMHRVAVWEQEQVVGGQFFHLGLVVHLGANRLLARKVGGLLRVKGKDVVSAASISPVAQLWALLLSYHVLVEMENAKLKASL